MTINLIHNEYVIMESWYEDVVSGSIIGITLLLSGGMGMATYLV